MPFYLKLNILMIAIPLLCSFEKRVRFYKKWPAVFLSILLNGLIYLIWDSYAVIKGHWSFNPLYAGDFTLFHIPIPEYLFFLIVPYCCLFMYEVGRYLIKDADVPVPRPLLWTLFILILLGMVAFYSQGYTVLVLLSLLPALIHSLFYKGAPFTRRSFWVYLFLSFFAFLVVNTLLTALPVVLYSDTAIWKIRVGTIPVEDFLYNFSMLTNGFLIYSYFKRRLLKQ